MARRNDHTRDQLTDLSVTTAIQIIDSKGITCFSARRLAKEIGYSVGTISQIFGGQEGLTLQINARTLQDLRAELWISLAGKQGVPALHALAKAYLRFSTKYAGRWAMLFDPATHARDVPDWYREKLDALFTLVENTVKPVVHNNDRLAYETARVLWAGLHGICVLAQSEKLELMGAASPERLSEMLIDTYVHGLGI